MYYPSNKNKKKIDTWKMICPMIFLHINGVIIDSFLEYGSSSNRVVLGGSVARANAAKESISMLIQSISTVLSGYESGDRVIDVTIIIKIAPKLIVN